MRARKTGRLLERSISVLLKGWHVIGKKCRFGGASQIIRRAYWRSMLNHLGENCSLHKIIVVHSPEKVSIGNNCSIAEFCHIWGGGEVSIGNDVLIASNVTITSVTHDSKADIYRESIVRKPVVISDNVWIGSGAIILPGVTIGSGAIIGAGAVVTSSVTANDVVAGVPARSISSQNR